MKSVDIRRLDRVHQEAAAAEVVVLASLKHPYIIRYHESFVQNGTLAIVMEYAEGGDLSKPINEARMGMKSLQEAQIVQWLTQILLGLKYVHGKNILHRDIKPQNLFLTQQDQLRIGDFGISKVLDRNRLAETKEVIGTPCYLSPEICIDAFYSFASDLWAVGCVLYELCALRVPFEGRSMHRVMRRITHGEVPTIPNHYSAELSSLGSALLQRDPVQRQSTDKCIQGRLIQNEISRMYRDGAPADSRPGSSAVSSQETQSPPSAMTSIHCRPRPAQLRDVCGALDAPLANSATELPSLTTPAGTLRMSPSAALPQGAWQSRLGERESSQHNKGSCGPTGRMSSVVAKHRKANACGSPSRRQSRALSCTMLPARGR